MSRTLPVRLGLVLPTVGLDGRCAGPGIERARRQSQERTALALAVSAALLGGFAGTTPAQAFPSVIQLSALDGTNGFKLDGEAVGDRSGRSVAFAGDINNDGFDDLIVGAYRAGPNGSLSGRSYVVFGGITGPGEIPALGLSTANLDFGLVLPGASGSAVLTVSNTGSADLLISQITDPAAPFAIVGGTCTAVPVTLTAGTSCDLSVQFAPVFGGVFNASFDILSNAPSSPDTVTLTGSAPQATPVPGIGRLGGLLLAALLALLGMGSLLSRLRGEIKPG